MPLVDERDWVTIGQVAAPHGVRGAVRVIPLTDVERRFERTPRVFARGQDPDDLWRALHIEDVTYHKDLVILKFREINSLAEAETLRDALLQVRADEVAPLPDGMYYVFQLVGLDVYTVDGEAVGRLADVITEGVPHDIYVIEREGREPALVPAVREFVRSIDLAAGRIVIAPIPGLL